MDLLHDHLVIVFHPYHGLPGPYNFGHLYIF